MKMISFWFLIFALATGAPAARAQDAATQAQLDQLSGQIQSISAALDVQTKRIEDLQKQVNDLQDKINQPGANNFASTDDLKKLADQVQQIDQKRQSDNEEILRELEKLEKALNVAASHHAAEPGPADSTAAPVPAPGTPQTGYNYEIKAGDTIAAVAKAYRQQGIKVTTDEILKANPGLNPNALRVGQKIFIPQPQ
jgi:LysM repeat protein